MLSTVPPTYLNFDLRVEPWEDGYRSLVIDSPVNGGASSRFSVSKQKVLGATLQEPDAEKQKMMLYSSMFSRTLWSMTYSNVAQGQCAECMRVCPVGREYRAKK